METETPEPVDQEAAQAILFARELILEEDQDRNGMSNQDKWSFIQEYLDEVHSQGFFAPIDFDRAYEWEIGNRLLAYGYIAALRSAVFLKMLKKAKEKPDQERFDFHYHVHQNYFLRIKDKYEAVSSGAKEWKHVWLN